MRALLARLSAGAALLVAGLLLTTGVGSAGGTGYDLSFAQAAPIPIADVALVGLDSQNPGGSNLTISLTVAGAFVLNNSSYDYRVVFTTGISINTSLQARFSNGSLGAYDGTVNDSPVSGPLGFSLTAGGSVLTFGISKSLVPPADAFGLTAFANATIGSTFAISELGTLGSGGSCSGPACKTGSGSSGSWQSRLSEVQWIALAALIALAIAFVALVVYHRRTRTPPPPAGGTT